MINSNEFRDKVVAVTGGAQGIGLCLVHTFAQSGAKVVYCDLKVQSGRYWERRLTDEGMDVSFIQADLEQETGARKFARTVVRRYQRTDVLINNVGILDFGQDFLRRPLQEWNRIISVNLTSYFLCSQLFAPELIKSKGCIVNIASTRALMSEPDTEPYSASKGGIVALTHSLAVTLGNRGVRVNCVSPRVDRHFPMADETFQAETEEDRPSSASRGPCRKARRHRSRLPFSRCATFGGVHHGTELRGRWRHDQENDLRVKARSSRV